MIGGKLMKMKTTNSKHSLQNRMILIAMETMMSQTGSDKGKRSWNARGEKRKNEE